MSYGLGFFEYFQLAEDIGAIGVPVLNAGLYCQARGKGPISMDSAQFKQYVQDMHDLIEFCRGDENSTWGKVRASLGHPEPFELKYICIGNENEGDVYFERYQLFLDSFNKAKAANPKLYEGLELIYSAGAFDATHGENYLPSYEYAKEQIGGGSASDFAGATDHHYYNEPSWFFKNTDYYDEENYRRSVDEMTDTIYGGGIQVFLGEYAAKANTMNAALAEAAFMTGLERNADIVHMATYAPLFAHVEGWQWRPDMIWFDNLRSVRTCSYYVQQLYAHNKGTNVLPLTMGGQPVSGQEGQDGLFASAVWDKDANTYIVKVINVGDKAQPISLNFTGLKKKTTLTDGKVITFHTDDLLKDNTVDAPNTIIPVESSIAIDGNVLNTQIGPKTFCVYKFVKNGK